MAAPQYQLAAQSPQQSAYAQQAAYAAAYMASACGQPAAYSFAAGSPFGASPTACWSPAVPQQACAPTPLSRSVAGASTVAAAPAAAAAAAPGRTISRLEICVLLKELAEARARGDATFTQARRCHECVGRFHASVARHLEPTHVTLLQALRVFD